MSNALDELRTISSGDPTATDVIGVVRSTASRLELLWLPLLQRLMTTDPLGSSWGRDVLLSGLDQSLIKVMADYGWSVQPDPRHDSVAVVTAEEARSLGARLNQVDVSALAVDREQLQWLAQQLAVIGRDPTLSSNFLANFHNWSTLTSVLGEQRARSYDPDWAQSSTPADIDPIFDGLMTIWRRSLPPTVLAARERATIASLLPEMEHADPYVQALLLRAEGLDPSTLAVVTDELLTAWVQRKTAWGAGASIDLRTASGPNAADILLPGLLRDPASCAQFVALATAHPAVLFETLNDPDIAYEVVLIGTDPSHDTPAAAGDAVVAILDYFHRNPYMTMTTNDGHPGEYGPFLADLVAPWLLQFTIANRDWDVDEFTKKDSLAVALNDEAALMRLVDNTARIANGFASTVITYDIDRTRQVGGLLTLVYQLVVEERDDDESERTRDGWNLLFSVAGTATNLLPGGVLVNIGAELAVQQFSDAAGHILDQPDPDGVRHQTMLAMDVTLVGVGAAALGGLFATWVAGAVVPADSPPPPKPDLRDRCPTAAYRVAVNKWLAQLPGGSNGPLAAMADNHVSAFIGNSLGERQCAELTH